MLEYVLVLACFHHILILESAKKTFLEDINIPSVMNRGYET
jgi:hypothetical protein